MTNNLYLVYTCNEWKERSSMSLIGTTSNFEYLKESVIKLLINDVIGSGENVTEIHDTENATHYTELNEIPYLFIDEIETNIINENGSTL